MNTETDKTSETINESSQKIDATVVQFLLTKQWIIHQLAFNLINESIKEFLSIDNNSSIVDWQTMANKNKDETKEAIREYFLRHSYRVKDEVFSKHFRQSIRGIDGEFINQS